MHPAEDHLPETPCPTVDSGFEGDTPDAVRAIGLGVVRLDGTLVEVDAVLAMLLGSDGPDRLEGRPITGMEETAERFAATLAADLSVGETRAVLVEVRRLDGTPIVLRVHARLGGEDAAGERRIAFSATPAAPSALHPRVDPRAAAESHATPGVVERFAARMAHAYNDLLTTIIGESRELMADLAPSSAGHESARSIMASAKRAAEITRRLLVFSRAEAARPETLDLNDTIHRLEDRLRIDLQAVDVDLALRLDPQVGDVRIDPEHLAIVLSSLVAHAADAMGPGGRTVVETARIQAPTETDGVEFRPAVPPGEYISISVGDTGREIDSDARSRVFDPFFTTKGDGLGLTPVYGLVLRARGHLGVVSTLAWGTRVRVLLPADPDAVLDAAPGTRIRSAPPPTPPAMATADTTILVVDDEGPVLRVISRILRRAGYTVVAVSDAYTAQDELRRRGGRVDLVISDVMMPRMKGTDLVRWIRDRTSPPPVLLVSGYADDELVRDWVGVDPTGFLSKPFEPNELLDRVRSRLEDRPATG